MAKKDKPTLDSTSMVKLKDNDLVWNKLGLKFMDFWISNFVYFDCDHDDIVLIRPHQHFELKFQRIGDEYHALSTKQVMEHSIKLVCAECGLIKFYEFDAVLEIYRESFHEYLDFEKKSLKEEKKNKPPKHTCQVIPFKRT